MPVSDLHYRVASVALGAAAGHGFALGGGSALLAHGVITRPTQDVGLFTDQERGVEAAAGAVEAALRDAGFEVERQDQATGLADIFPGMGEGLAEWIVAAPDGQGPRRAMLTVSVECVAANVVRAARTSMAVRSARTMRPSCPRTGLSTLRYLAIVSGDRPSMPSASQSSTAWDSVYPFGTRIRLARAS